MILNRASFLIVRFTNSTNKSLLSRCSLSTDRSESVSAALKQFYFKVHPDLFTQYPKEKVNYYKKMNHNSLLNVFYSFYFN